MAQCAVCGTTVRRSRLDQAICGARTCRQAWLGPAPRAAQRMHNRTVRAEAERIAAHVNDAQPNPSRATRMPLALLPSNDRVSSAMPAKLRERFLERLGPKLAAAMEHVAEARDSLRESPANADSAPSPVTPAERLFANACATCRGECCTGGTDHAHLDVASLERAAITYGWTTVGEAHAAYARQIPHTHYHESCVYHGVRGCTLPRDMRADICNRHLCGSLSVLTRAINDGARPPFIAIAATWLAPQRAAIIDVDGMTPIARARR